MPRFASLSHKKLLKEKCWQTQIFLDFAVNHSTSQNHLCVHSFISDRA